MLVLLSGVAVAYAQADDVAVTCLEDPAGTFTCSGYLQATRNEWEALGLPIVLAVVVFFVGFTVTERVLP